MKTNKKTVVLDLPGDVKVKYSLQRAGQQAPGEGDGIIVQAKIYLPSAGPFSDLDSRIQFRDRVHLGGVPLHCNWGVADDKGFRYYAKEFVAAKWSQAFAEAEAWARDELQKLADALARRAEALKNAE